MRTRTGSQAALLAALLALAILMPGGCAKKTGIERQEKTTTSMEKVDSDVNQANAQIDSTNRALNDVIRIGQSPTAQPQDVKSVFNIYSENVKKMEESAKTLNNHTDQMNAQGNAYFTEWRKEGNTYVNPNIQALSEERRVQLRKTFTNIASSSINMRASLNAYLSDIKQIQTYLSNDLTPAGIAAITPIARNAQRDGDNVRNSSRPMQAAIEQARLEMTPGPGAAAGGGASQGTAPGMTPGAGGTGGGGAQGTAPGTMSAPTTSAPAATGNAPY